jgi:hypothetical protein
MICSPIMAKHDRSILSPSRTQEPSGQVDRLVTAQQLADYLEVPIATLYAWRYRHEGPPGFRVGRHLRYQWRDVETWIVDQMGRSTRYVG